MLNCFVKTQVIHLQQADYNYKVKYKEKAMACFIQADLSRCQMGTRRWNGQLGTVVIWLYLLARTDLQEGKVTQRVGVN